MSKLEPYSDDWEKEAGEVARSFVGEIYPCGKCDYPVVDGYCCGSCGDSSPSMTVEQENAWNEKYKR